MRILLYILAVAVGMHLFSNCFKFYRCNNIYLGLSEFYIETLDEFTFLKFSKPIYKFFFNLINELFYVLLITIFLCILVIIDPFFFWPYMLWLRFKRPSVYMGFKTGEDFNKFMDYKSETDFNLGDHICYLYLSIDAPFKPDEKQLIYIENSYNEFCNQYIAKNYYELNEYIIFQDLVFCYLPKLVHKIKSKKRLHYRSPSSNKIRYVSTKPLESNLMIPYVIWPKEVLPGFILYRKEIGYEEMIHEIGHDNPFYEIGTKQNVYKFVYYPFLPDTEVPFECQIQAFIRGVRGVSTFYRMVPVDDADWNFSEDIEKLMSEVRERVNKLRICGVDELILRSLFHPDDKLSRLVISKSNRIFLPDYNNMEIKMTPLPKAVFFLFLRHPEGIMFKCLMDFRRELKEIYGFLSGRQDIEALNQSIDDLTNPTKNSINEKCARIRESFICKFDDSLAKNYYVTGERGEPKKIVLPRDLVRWENGFDLQASNNNPM